MSVLQLTNDAATEGENGIEEWFSKHDLSEFVNLQKIKDDKVKINDLRDLDPKTNDVEEFCKAYDIVQFIHKKRFKKGLNALHSTLPANTIIISSDDQIAIHNLDALYENVINHIKQITKRKALIEEKSLKCTNQITTYFDEINKMTNKRKEYLLIKLKNEQLNKNKIWETNLNKMYEYKKIIENTQKEIRTALNKKQNLNIQTTTKGIIQHEIHSKEHQAGFNQLKKDITLNFIVDKDKTKKFVQQMGKIHFSNVPLPPVLTNKNITATSIHVELTDDNKEEKEYGELIYCIEVKDDEEKESKWIERKKVKYNESKNIELKALKPNNDYKIRAKTCNDLESSIYSNVLVAKTKNLVLAHKFEFDVYEPEYIKLEKQGLVVQGVHGCSYTIVSTKQGFSHDVHSWKIKIIDLAHGCYTNFGCLTDINNLSKISRLETGSDGDRADLDCCGIFYMWNGYNRKLKGYVNGKMTLNQGNGIQTVALNDIITMTLDCNQWTLAFKRNNENVGTINIPQNNVYHPCIYTCACKKQKFELV